MLRRELLSIAAREQEEYQVLEVTLNLIASLGQIHGLLQELRSSTLCSAKQIVRLRKIISANAPSAGTLRAHNLSFKRFLLWGSDRKLSPSECFLKTTSIDVADFMEKLTYLATSRRFPAVESWILWFYGRCSSRNLPESQSSRCFKHAMRGTTCCHSVLAFNLTLSFLVLQAISHPLFGVVGTRKTSKLRVCGLFSHILKASHR